MQVWTTIRQPRDTSIGLNYWRENVTAHVDMEPTSTLINNDGEDLELADFSTSVFIDQLRPMNGYDLTIGSVEIHKSLEHFLFYLEEFI